METQKKTLSKSARLTWLLLYRLSGGKMTLTEYARKFGIHVSNAMNDDKDMQPLVEMIESSLPNIKELVQQTFNPEDLKNIPVLPINLGDHSKVSLDLQIDHKTGEITWAPFTQTIYDQDNKKMAKLRIQGGAKTGKPEKA